MPCRSVAATMSGEGLAARLDLSLLLELAKVLNTVENIRVWLTKTRQSLL